MFILRRWWIQYGTQLTVALCVVGLALLLKQTQAKPIWEVYQFLAAPFTTQNNQEQLFVNAHIQELEGRLAELEQQNQKLQSLLGYTKKQSQSVITAPVIGRSADYWWQQVTIGRGSKDGIQKGFIATGIGGLIGRVVEVTPHTSRILLISDSNSNVGVTISRTRYLGVLKGQNSQLAVLQFFEKVPDIRVGDVVVTSSLSRLFPGGFPVGKVKSVNVNTGPAPEALVEISAPLTYLEWLVIHPVQ